MPLSYEQILRGVESLSRAEQFQLISDVAENLRVEATQQVRTSILELQGLGKEIWRGIDAQDYVDRERESWSS